MELWLGSYTTLEWLQNRSTIDTFLSKKTICLFNECVDKALNFKDIDMYFVNTYIKHLKRCHFMCYICHLTLTLSCSYISYKLVAVYGHMDQSVLVN